MAFEYRTMNMYLIQSPESVWQGGSDPLDRGYNRDLLRYFRKKGGMPVQDIGDFIKRVYVEVTQRRALIKKLVIGSHGTGEPTNSGHFRLGKTIIMEGDDKELHLLGAMRRFLVRDAEVYILACRTGYATDLLRKVSYALGGVRVYGYTEFITTTSYGFFGVGVDDGTSDGGKEVVCWPSICLNGPARAGWR
jgi:hypothetical protein